jgi:hypothetical protein
MNGHCWPSQKVGCTSRSMERPATGSKSILIYNILSKLCRIYHGKTPRWRVLRIRTLSYLSQQMHLYAAATLSNRVCTTSIFHQLTVATHVHSSQKKICAHLRICESLRPAFICIDLLPTLVLSQVFPLSLHFFVSYIVSAAKHSSEETANQTT